MKYSAAEKKEAYLKYIGTKKEEENSRYIETSNRVNANIRQLKKERWNNLKKLKFGQYKDETFEGLYQQVNTQIKESRVENT